MVGFLLIVFFIVVIGWAILSESKTSYPDEYDPDKARRDANRRAARKWLDENPLPHRSRSPSSRKQHISDTHTDPNNSFNHDHDDPPTY